jgi:antitoxin (DNA-binding transcriptional repressor) of toxin-antitoxin stability system
MKTATVRDLRYHFSAMEALLNKGEEIEIRKRRKVIAHLKPVRPKAGGYPDFAAIRKEIFGNKTASQTGTELVSESRGAYGLFMPLRVS